MESEEDRRKIRVLVAYGDHIQEDVIVELESTRWNIPPDEIQQEAMILLAEAAIQVAKQHDSHYGFQYRR